MLKIYGTSMSRGARVLWAAEELGLSYEHIPVGFDGAAKKPDYLKVNPNGKVPAIDDDGLTLFESMAVNLYLADKYGKAPFWPSSPAGRGQAYQWSLYAMTELEPPLMTILMNKMLLPAEQRSEKAIADATEALKAPIAVIAGKLAGRDYLLGSDFTIADLNLAAVMSIGAMTQVDLSGATAANAWLGRCLSRAAYQKASKMK
jgi:glutathione S-transferase